MIPHFIFTIFVVLSFGFVAAQNSNPTGRELKSREEQLSQDVSTTSESEPGLTGIEAAISGAVKVMGKPNGADGSVASSENTTHDLVAIAADQKPQQLENGPVLGVELLQASTVPVNPKQLTVLAPYPAKPLSTAPAGWHLEIRENVPHHTRVVELVKGVRVAFTVKPHILVPDADGAEIFSIAEPGYDAPLGAQQTTTVGAVLATSINQLDEDCVQLGTAIDNLQQLLVTLPKPESQSTPPAPIATPGKKR